jgi:hypothetical protein
MQASVLRKFSGWLMIGGLLLSAGCAAGEVQTYRPTSYPVYRSPYYYPDLGYQEADPQFWSLWQNSQGGP